ncbi:MAG: threonylcarbamoyl-AMP synthase [Acholeplasmatales bacterium]|nr:MAG: threonylcarbamoyl-AMP synthase [Acholeplasmatales bacterium]
MKTRIYTADMIDHPDVKADIKKTLLSGKHVVFPTETVYGIGAYALHETGILNIYRVKGRPSDNPLIMHLPSPDTIAPYVVVEQPYVNALMDAFWPGPLTLVCKKKDTVPLWLTGGLDTVGIRLPSHPVAQKVLNIAGIPICAPSANLSGRPSATLFEHVLDDFNHRVDIIIDGGKSEVGLESTVLDVTQIKPVILRPGVITKTMLEDVVGPVEVQLETPHDIAPRSPGMKYKHYAPKGEMVIVEGETEKVVTYIKEQITLQQQAGRKVGVIATDDLMEQFAPAYVYTLGDVARETDIAANLYIALRRMDALDMDVIYSIAFHQSVYQEVIMNRLYKAANHRVIKV